jgi:GMP synthase-like glutamine amidotransferase
MKLTFLICDYVNDDLVPRHGTLADIFRRFAADWPASEVREFRVDLGEIPPLDYCSDGYLISGSRHSVNDIQPWIKGLEQFLVEKLYQDGNSERFVGLCWGHQMLAKATGGLVERPQTLEEPNGVWHVGNHPVSVVSERQDTVPLPSSFSLLFNHREQVTKLGSQTQILASAAGCPISMFSFQEKAIGLQAHPEYTRDYQEALMEVVQGLSSEKRLDALKRNENYEPSAAINAAIRDFLFK